MLLLRFVTFDYITKERHEMRHQIFINAFE